MGECVDEKRNVEVRAAGKAALYGIYIPTYLAGSDGAYMNELTNITQLPVVIHFAWWDIPRVKSVFTSRFR